MFHKNYQKGEIYRHTAARENDISMVLNQLCGFRLNGQSAASSGVVRISCYNSSTEKLSSGSAVMVSESASLCGDSIPVEKCSDDQKPWAVLENYLDPKKIGSAIVAGCAVVDVSGSAMDYIAPDTQNPGTFKFSDTGTARVLFSGNGKCIVLLGVGTNDSYDGPFALAYDANTRKVTVTAGYLNRNGEWLNVPTATIVPASSGMVCVCTTLGSDGAWTVPEVKVTTPGQYAFPIGSMEVSGNSVTVSSFRVPVAIFIVSGVCGEYE